MKILFVCPQPDDLLITTYDKKKTSLFHKLMARSAFLNKNLSLPILAALTPKNNSIFYQEGTTENINFDLDCDIVGITYTTLDACCAYEIADEFRRRGKKVILGGYHASALPEEAKHHADAVVIGEAEYIWPKLLDDFKKNQLKDFYKQDKSIDPKDVPFPMFNLYQDSFLLGIQSARGCPIGCEFCAITNSGFRNIFRARPIENVLEEIRLKPQKSISFYDPSLTTNPKYSKSLFRGIIEMDLNKDFSCYGNIHVLAKDQEILRLASEAGVKQWEIGFESVCQNSLNAMGKSVNKVDKYSRGIKNIHNYNMMVLGDFVFGFDSDDANIGKSTLDFVNQSDLDIPDVQILTPFPGTPLFERLDKKGRIITKDWSKYDFEHVVFQPKNMTVDELFYNAKDFFKQSYKKRKIFKRVMKSMSLGFDTFQIVVFENLCMATKRYV